MRKIPFHLYSLLYVGLILLFSSCASAFHGNSQLVNIRTNVPAKEVIVNGEKYPLGPGGAFMRAERNKEPLVIGIQSGDSLQSVTVKSKSSLLYVLDAVYSYGLSLLVERNNPKRYSHSRYIFLDQNKDKIILNRFMPAKKGCIDLTLSIPYLNLFYTRMANGKDYKTGFLGIGGGADFYYREKRYLSLQFSKAIDHEAPVPVGVDHSGAYEKTNVVFLSARNNHIIRSFDFGYGFSFSRFNWLQTDTTSSIKFRKSIDALGLSASAHYRVSRTFKLGFFYQPAVFNIDNGLKPDYQHLFSVELLFAFRTKKG